MGDVVFNLIKCRSPSVKRGSVSTEVVLESERVEPENGRE